MVNIGLRIKEELQQQERTISWLARKLNCNRSTVYRILNKNSIDTMLLDLQPAKLFINIGTNDLRPLPDGADWFAHLADNYRRICETIRDKLPDTKVYMMAYYPVNSNVPLAQGNSSMLVRTNENIARANKMVEDLAAEFGFHYIDVNDELKDENGNLKAEHTLDGIHFDAAAYRTVFERLKKYL